MSTNERAQDLETVIAEERRAEFERERAADREAERSALAWDREMEND